MKLRDLTNDQIAGMMQEVDTDCNHEMYRDGDAVQDDFYSMSREDLIFMVSDGKGEDTLFEDTIIGYLNPENFKEENVDDKE